MKLKSKVQVFCSTLPGKIGRKVWRGLIKLRGFGRHSYYKLSMASFRYHSTQKKHLFDPEFCDRLAKAPAVCVVICVYNKPEVAIPCITSTIQSIGDEDEIVIVNDSSTDENLSKFLEKISTTRSVTVISNPENLGYTRSVNIGIKAAGDRDVILLNSDTRVWRGWIARLRRAAYSMGNVASATAVSNNAGAFTVSRDSDGFAASSDHVATVARKIRNQVQPTWPIFPTCNGFCVYIRRDAINSVGLFNEELFPIGYGEENDWTERARQLGWVNRTDETTFIWHQGTATFTNSRKDQLLAKAMDTMARLHPTYHRDVSSSMQSGSFPVAMNNSRKASTSKNSSSSSRILFLIHSGSGGSRKTVDDLVQNIGPEFDAFLLVSDGQLLKLYRFDKRRLRLFWSKTLRQSLYFTTGSNHGYESFVQNLIVRLGIDLVNVHHLIHHPSSLMEMLGHLRVPIVLNIHDYFFICPSTNLLDEKGIFCEGTCTVTRGNCNKNSPHWTASTAPPLKHNYVFKWREGFQKDFAYVDKMVFPNSFPLQLFEKFFPSFTGKFTLIEHGLQQIPSSRHVPPNYQRNKKVRVVVFGRLSYEKGLWDLVALGKFLGDHPEFQIELHFLGDGNRRLLRGLGKIHGSYRNKSLTRKIMSISPDFALFLSPWGETYSYALSEALLMEIPVIARRVGALNERLKNNQGVTLLDSTNPEEIVRAVMAATDDTTSLNHPETRRNSDVRSLGEMVDDYKRLFQELLAT